MCTHVTLPHDRRVTLVMVRGNSALQRGHYVPRITLTIIPPNPIRPSASPAKYFAVNGSHRLQHFTGLLRLESSLYFA